MNYERRFVTADFEVRTVDGAPAVVAGHGAVFNRRSQKLFEPRLGPFIEQVAPGAFTKTLRETDVRALFNHDPNLILGRSSAGTLRVGEDPIGLAYDFDVPDTTYGRDLVVSMRRRDVTQSSFTFRVIGDGEDWSLTEDGFPLRTLNEVGIGDVSPVTYPAYPDSDSGLRCALSHLAEVRSISPDEAVALARDGQLGALIAGKKVTEPVGPTPSDLAARRLELMRRRRPTPAA